MRPVQNRSLLHTQCRGRRVDGDRGCDQPRALQAGARLPALDKAPWERILSIVESVPLDAFPCFLIKSYTDWQKNRMAMSRESR